MAMRRPIIICLLALSAATVLLSAPAASAAKRNGKTPQITRVTPMRVSVGNLLTIHGRNFKAKRRANTVIFRSASGRSAFAKPRRATRKKLVVVVPEAAARLLTVRGSRQRPTRLKLRVLAGRFSPYTTRRLSPVVTGVGEGDGKPGGGRQGGGPAATVKICNDGGPAGDHDHDLISNQDEPVLGTDPCLEDTDGDTMTDGWEYYSARDLNIKNVPYPGKRPFPNALDPSDGGPGPFSEIDFDGDGLTTQEEYRLWRYTGSSFIPGKAGGLDLESPLGYSDGTKFSRASETPGVPAWRSALYGLTPPTQPFPATYNLRGDGVYPGSSDDAWRDHERDADADGLSNRLESARGPYANAWWASYWQGFEPAPEPFPNTYFGYFDERPFANLDLADPDVDGDSLLDGEDDQDNDDFNNITELYETEYDLDGDGNPIVDTQGKQFPSLLRLGDNWIVNAMNPCAPSPDSRTCPEYGGGS
jgi:hypothetical protein